MDNIDILENNENLEDSLELNEPVDYTELVRTEMIQFNNGELIPYKEITIVENNGINVVFDTSSIEDIKNKIPQGIISARAVLHTENESVSDFELGIYNDIALRSISLDIFNNTVSALLPGLSDAAKQYFNTNQKIEQIEANVDYIAMESGIEL